MKELQVNMVSFKQIHHPLLKKLSYSNHANQQQKKVIFHTLFSSIPYSTHVSVSSGRSSRYIICKLLSSFKIVFKDCFPKCFQAKYILKNLNCAMLTVIISCMPQNLAKTRQTT